MMVKIRERYPAMVVYLAETRVQGDGAAEEIAATIRRLDESKLVDVIIVARGGGSLEDLWAFNEEVVVKAVFAASVPVVSGVGHETDTTLCDLAADVRAPTPTAAAEMVVPKVTDLLARVAELERRLLDTDRWLQPIVQRVDELSMRLDARAVAVLAEARLRIKTAEAKLASIRPDKVLELLRGRIELFHGRLFRMGTAATQRLQSSVIELGERLKRALPSEKIQQNRVVVEGLYNRLGVGARRSHEAASDAVKGLELRLSSLNPQKVLERGYSIVTVNGRHIRSVDDVKVGEEMSVSIIDGVLTGVIADRSKEKKW
jgi:exodeoxyribonuclease VII large subunit